MPSEIMSPPNFFTATPLKNTLPPDSRMRSNAIMACSPVRRISPAGLIRVREAIGASNVSGHRLLEPAVAYGSTQSPHSFRNASTINQNGSRETVIVPIYPGVRHGS